MIECTITVTKDAATWRAIRHSLSRPCCCPSIAGWPRRSNPGRRNRGSPRPDREQRGERILAGACAMPVLCGAPWRRSPRYSEQAIGPRPKRTASSLFPIAHCQPNMWFGRQSSPSAGGSRSLNSAGCDVRPSEPKSPLARGMSAGRVLPNGEPSTGSPSVPKPQSAARQAPSGA